MNLKSVKDISKLRLADVAIEWVSEDGFVREVRLSDPKGACIVIRTGGSYSDFLKVFEIAPGEPVTTEPA